MAQDNIGLSYLGICHKSWPCEESIDAYKNKIDLKLSFLYDKTFGEDCSCIRKLYQDPRAKLTRIHLSNGPGLRNRRLQKTEIFYGYNIISAEAAILRNDPELKKKFEDVAQRAANDYKESVGINNLYVSTCLECNFSALARERLINWAKPFFSKAQFVDNPLFGPCMPGLICEKHGDSPELSAPCIVDLDGKDFNLVDIARFKDRYKTCLATFLWGAKLNLNDTINKNFIPPLEREKIPDKQYFENLINK